MGGLFSVRLAPGLRISATSRGLRAHAGPRGARVHVGAGRPGVSTGAGPFTWYQSMSGGPSRGRGGAYYPGPTRGQIAAAAKEEQAALIRRSLDAIANQHRQTFPVAVKPLAVAAPLPPYPELLSAYERRELEGVGWFDLARRRAAKARARSMADAYAEHLMSQADIDRARAAEEIDEAWRRLLDNDPDELMAALRSAFEDNEAPVAPVGFDGDEVHLVVLVPTDEAIPEREPAVTAAGNLSMRKMNKSATSGWYRTLVAGHVLVSAKESLAIAPGLQAARVIAVQDDRPGSRGEGPPRPVLAVRLTRTAVDSANWAETPAWDLLTEASAGSSLVNLARTTGALKPLDLSGQPDIAEVVAAFAHPRG